MRPALAIAVFMCGFAACGNVETARDAASDSVGGRRGRRPQPVRPHPARLRAVLAGRCRLRQPALRDAHRHRRPPDVSPARMTTTMNRLATSLLVIAAATMIAACGSVRPAIGD